MSCYFTTDRYNIVVRLDKLDKAVKFLEDSYIYDVPGDCRPIAVHVEDIDGKRFRLVPEWDPFSGTWSNSGPEEEIEEFLKKYCEPGSYVSQRSDDYFEYSAYWLDEGRNVKCDWKGFENPFGGVLDDLENEEE